MERSNEVFAALILILEMSMPVVLVATIVGLVVGLLQALTQIQDQTLPLAVKLIAVALTIFALGLPMALRLHEFAERLFGMIPLV